MKVLVKTRETRFSLPLLLVLLLIPHVLNIVVDQILLVLLLRVMMTQGEMVPMMVVFLEMMVEILHIHNKVNIH